MQRSGVVLVAALAVVTLGGARPASAYDPTFTHRWISRMAIEHLRATYPGQYDDVLPYVEDYVAGNEQEDNLILDGDDDPATLRVMRHFYRPTDGAGLTYGGKTFPDSLTWATDPDDANPWGYDDALAYYRAGDLAKAYFALGHVTHLLQDATVPAHTHLEPHGPPTGDDFETYCSSQMHSEHSGDLPRPPPGTPIPAFATLEDLWVATARATYFRNTVPGALSDVETGHASGVLREMFPDIEIDLLTQTWEIPEVGRLGWAFWEYAPGRFYFATLDGVGQVDRIAFDPRSPETFVFGVDGAPASMSANMARDLIPLAILHSASLLKRFMDETRDIEVGGGEDATDEPAAAAGCRAGGLPGGAGAGAGGLLVALLALRSGRTKEP